jgi:hypothetical protein
VTFEGRRCEYQYIGATSGGALVEGAGTHDWPGRGDGIEATVEGTRACRRCRSAALVGRVQVALRSEVAIRQLASAGCQETPRRDCRCSLPASPARSRPSPRPAKVITSEQTLDQFARGSTHPPDLWDADVFLLLEEFSSDLSSAHGPLIGTYRFTDPRGPLNAREGDLWNCLLEG